MDSMFLLFVSIGFVAQLLDGSIGMGFGLISYTVLINMGYPPAVVSASVNGAKLFTGTVSGVAHFRLKNIDWRMLRLVAGGGVVGALAGSLLLIKLPHDWLVPLINCYLIGVGIIILWRAGQSNITKASSLKTAVVGLAGGVLESLAGVWGPMVTSNLVAAGSNPRMVVGTVTVAEVFVAVVVFVILVGHLGFSELSTSALGLMAGALLAAPFAARLTKQLPRNVLMIAVGLLVIATSGYRLYRFF